MSTLLFAGDPHGDFAPVIAAVRQAPPDAVILLGDLDLDRPLEEAVAPILEAGVELWWIPGNHEGDRVEWHDFAFHSALADANLHARVVEIAGVRVAGLGGIFRRHIWYPTVAAPNPVHPERMGYVAGLDAEERWRGGVPMRHRVSLWWEDVERLRRERADILVAHEAPHGLRRGGRPVGWTVLDGLATAMGVHLVVHGHHHIGYRRKRPDGVQVVGVGRAAVWRLDTAALPER